jgi:glycosyltransferase
MSEIKISIITATLNSSETITTCLNSIKSQSIPVEHIIKDGGSTDGTLDIIKQ